MINPMTQPPQRPEIPQWLRTALHKLVPAPRHFLIAPDATLGHDLNLDSLATLDLAEALLDETGHEPRADAIDRWHTVGDIIAYAETLHV